MNNNDILRRLRDILDFNESKLLAIFALAGNELTREQLKALLKRDDEAAHKPCSDRAMAGFLDGLIIETRGKRESDRPVPEQGLTNNIIFMKLKIALDLKTDDVLEILSLAGLELGRNELGALFRRSDNKHYRVCKDEVLLGFLRGLQLHYRERFGLVVPSETE